MELRTGREQVLFVSLNNDIEAASGVYREEHGLGDLSSLQLLSTAPSGTRLGPEELHARMGETSALISGAAKLISPQGRVHLFSMAQLPFMVWLGLRLRFWANVVAHNYNRAQGTYAPWVRPRTATHGHAQQELRFFDVVPDLSTLREDGNRHSDGILCIDTLTRNPESFEAALPAELAGVGTIVHASPREVRADLSPVELARILNDLGQIVDVAHDIFAQKHLFLKTTPEIAFFIGQILNAKGPIALYEYYSDIPPARYEYICHLGDEPVRAVPGEKAQAQQEDPPACDPIEQLDRGHFNLLNVFARKTVEQGTSFADYDFFMIVHFLPDIIDFLGAYEVTGLDPLRTTLLYKQYDYRTKQEQIGALSARGYNVAPIEKLDQALRASLDRCEERGARLVIVEDGGYVIPKLHEPEFVGRLGLVLGSVEQTERGCRNNEQLAEQERLLLPVMDVSRTRIKNDHEPRYIGEAIVRNIRGLLPNIKLTNKVCLVVGFGSIGQAVAEKAALEMKKVVVFDTSRGTLARAAERKYETVTTLDAGLRMADLVIGCSGETSLTEEHIASLQHGTCLVSGSSGRHEIGWASLEQHAKGTADRGKSGTTYYLRPDDRKVMLLADGYPVNFHDASSAANEDIDIILTALYLATLLLVKDASTVGPGIHTAMVDRYLAEVDLEGKYYDMYYNK